MLSQEQQENFNRQTTFLQTMLSDSERPAHDFLVEYAHLAQKVGHGAHVLLDIFTALAALGEFKAEEIMPEQWVIESHGKVIAFGPTFADAAAALIDPDALGWDDLISIDSADF